MESSGITLLKGDLMGIVKARQVSQATMRNIRQNLFFAFVYNVAGIPLAAGVVYPFFGLLLSPTVAAAAMALSSVSVIANSLRLQSVRLCSYRLYDPRTGSGQTIRCIDHVQIASGTLTTKRRWSWGIGRI
jgi:hypothetical protein